ncbi:UDP-GlcNAc:betaGal beta-1,3-N-acetylglucosaminyltransferase 7, like [Brachyhypopomus gauderio]|uniref:UDP-GlcNAc:betaGal beta-1,3-N-acetylglucosaminyltransferase 7, like n=1 Tax=Brachyhypopomus gauderio TaxID=698409 RepID=UPI004042578B
MDHLFRRKRALKTLLSLTLVFATLLMIQKFKVVDINMKEFHLDVKNGWCGSQCATVKTKRISPVKKYSLSSQRNELDSTRTAPVNKSALSTWNINKINCTENSDMKSKPWFKKLDLRFHQFVLHRHCRYFPMLINHPEKCSSDLDILVVVKSVIEHHDRREAVRKTWGKEKTIHGKKIKTLFLLGVPSPGKDSKNLQKLIEYEDTIYGDILQWNFMDTFFNLTLKEVNFLRWFNIYCTEVPFIFKGDDDVFVNINNLVDLIGFRIQEHKVHNLFAGDTISKAIPIRNRQSKYFIPKELFDKPYPPYVGGGGFLMSSVLARRLFTVSQSVELFPIDDVFLGMCLQKLGLAPEMHSGFKTFGITKRTVSPMNREPCFFRHLIVVHKLNPEELLRMWSIVHNENLTCAKRRAL